MIYDITISGDDIAGRWLRCYDYEQDQNVMRSNLSQITDNPPLSLKQGSKCNCKKTPLLDELGHHISTACRQGGHRIMTHDSVKICIKDLLNSCGIKTRVEVAEYFRVTIPENNQRPDLMLYDAPDFNKPVVADVCNTCPIPVAASAPLLITDARKPGRAAGITRTGKETKNKAACDANGSSYYQFLLSLLVLAGARRVMISSKKY
jgi:hypothetical protein